jgi:uncharacterized membrane protein
MSKTENKAAFETIDLWMLLTTMVWAVNLSLIKFSLREFTPHGFNGVRLALSAAIFLVVLAFRRGGFSLGRGDFLKVAVLGLLGTTIYQLLFIQGISRTQATTTSMIMPMTPVFIAVLSSVFRLERIHWAAWLGIAVSFLAVHQGRRLPPSGQPGLGPLHRPLQAAPGKSPPRKARRLIARYRYSLLPALCRRRRETGPLGLHQRRRLGVAPLFRRPGDGCQFHRLLQFRPDGREY